MKKKLLNVTCGFMIVLLLIATGYAVYLYQLVSYTADDIMHDDVERISDKRRVDPGKKQPLAFLIMGTDERKTEQGRTDTLIVITVNPNEPSMKMVSIPRDARTMIVGRGLDKINHAHAFGGVPMTIATVEQFLDIPIDYYIKINMRGFKEIVDALGGITVNNRFAFTQSKIHFPKGVQRLDGVEALAYVRMRKQDPRGDKGRNERQRKVIMAIVIEMAQLSSLPKVNSILEAIGHNIRTDLNFDEWRKLHAKYRHANQEIEEIEFQGSGKIIQKTWYLVIPEYERVRVAKDLKQHLEITEKGRMS